MKLFFTTIIITICATITVNAQSSIRNSFSATLSGDNVSSANANIFVKESSANGVLFSAKSTAPAKRLVITNVETNEVLISNVMEISTEFAIDMPSKTDFAFVANERTTLEIED